MREEKIGKHKVKIYDSIDELPIARFHKYNKYLLIDSGIGSDLEDMDGHLNKAMRYAKTNPELCVKELQNLRQMLYLVSSSLNTEHLAFAVLVTSIDDEPMNDLSDTGLKRVLEILNEVPKHWIDRLIELVKKKIDEELRLYYPSLFDDAGTKELYDKLKERVILVLDSIIEEEDKKEDINRIDDFLLTLSKPKTFYGKDSAEIQYDKQFENMNLILSQQLSVNPNSMTVLQYYNAFEYLKKMNKNNKSNGR
jgi:hypothetical protein